MLSLKKLHNKPIYQANDRQSFAYSSLVPNEKINKKELNIIK